MAIRCRCITQHPGTDVQKTEPGDFPWPGTQLLNAGVNSRAMGNGMRSTPTALSSLRNSYTDLISTSFRSAQLKDTRHRADADLTIVDFSSRLYNSGAYSPIGTRSACYGVPSGLRACVVRGMDGGSNRRRQVGVTKHQQQPVKGFMHRLSPQEPCVQVRANDGEQ